MSRIYDSHHPSGNMSTSLPIRFIEVRKWPGKKTTNRTIPAFKAGVRLTGRLEDQLKMFGARNVTVAGFWKPGHLKRDGGIYADARPTEPGVIVEFEAKGERYQLFADKFLSWQDNLEAIARIIEDLRRMERYGVRGANQLMSAFRALPPEGGTTEAKPPMTPEAAALFLAEENAVVAGALLTDRYLAEACYRRMRSRHHPDQGGDPGDYATVEEAWAALRDR